VAQELALNRGPALPCHQARLPAGLELASPGWAHLLLRLTEPELHLQLPPLQNLMAAMGQAVADCMPRWERRLLSRSTRVRRALTNGAVTGEEAHAWARVEGKQVSAT
jgi:hypothetical protein